MIIGIIGKSGSGKSTISKMILEYKVNTIYCDIDKIGHSSLLDENIKQKLINTFGNQIITNNEIDRKKLSQIVFEAEEKMNFLKSLTKDYINKQVNKIIEENKNKTIILDYALLPLLEAFDKCDLTILVDASYEIRLERIMKRDIITEKQFMLREQASVNYTNYKFDYVLDNNDLTKTKEKVKIIYDKSFVSG